MIEIKNIYKSYKEVKALQDISINIKESEFFGLIGPDGAGKTTLMRIICSLLIPDSGLCTVNNLDIVKDYKEVRKILGYVPGKFSLYQDLTVKENLEFFASVFKSDIKENYHLIKDIYQQIEEFENRKAGKLSGGMKQKLALSCALIHKPKILILDEPATGVDAVARVDFWNMLKNLQKEGITIVVSTPYMDDAANCDNIALLQNSKLLSVDSPKNITKKYDKDLYQLKTKDIYNAFKSTENLEYVNSAYIFGSNLHISLKKDADIMLLKNHLSDVDITEYSLIPIEANIEDCFLDLTQ